MIFTKCVKGEEKNEVLDIHIVTTADMIELKIGMLPALPGGQLHCSKITSFG